MSMVIFNSYVKLPEGIWRWPTPKIKHGSAMKCHEIFGCHEVPFLGWISGAIFSGFPCCEWPLQPCFEPIKPTNGNGSQMGSVHIDQAKKTAECLHRLPSCRLKLANTAHFKANPGLVSHWTSPIRFPCGSQQKLKLLRKARHKIGWICPCTGTLCHRYGT